MNRMGALEWAWMAVLLIALVGMAWAPEAMLFEVLWVLGLIGLAVLSLLRKRSTSTPPPPLPAGLSDQDSAALATIRRQGWLLFVPLMTGFVGALCTNWFADIWGAYRQLAAAVFVLMIVVALVPALLLRRRHFAIVDRYGGTSAAA